MVRLRPGNEAIKGLTQNDLCTLLLLSCRGWIPGTVQSEQAFAGWRAHAYSACVQGHRMSDSVSWVKFSVLPSRSKI